MQWFREARYGIFLHWGLYSIPAGEWKGRALPGSGESIMRDARIPVKEYEQFATLFNPAQFDAETWVKFAEDSGARYLVVTAKGRDGFAMFRSAVSRYNVYDATPFHRDPLKELAEACAKHHMRLGFAYSQAEDWHESNGAGNDWDFPRPTTRDLDPYLRGKAEPQIKELLTAYGPVSLIWLDSPREMTPAASRRFIDLVRQLQPSALLDGRLGDGADSAATADNLIPGAVVKGDWEVQATVNQTAGFKKFDNNWKSEDDLVFELVDTVSKGGNYLVSAGPTADGLIPRPILLNLHAVGDWLKVNGDAIYGAGPTAFGDEFSAAAASIRWRCTTKPGKLFLTLFQWPDRPFQLEKVSRKVTAAYLLADPLHAPLRFTQEGGRVAVTLPKDPPLDGPLPDRINPALATMAARTHVRSVLVLEEGQLDGVPPARRMQDRH